MRVIKSDSGFLAYQKIFRQMVSQRSEVVLWQIFPTGERLVSESYVNSFHTESALMHLVLSNEKEINSDLPIYLYSETGQFICKTKVFGVKSATLSIHFPEEIKFLEEPEVTFIRGSIGHDMSESWKVHRHNFSEEPISDILKVKSMSERSDRDQEFLNNEFDSVSLDQEDKMFADKRESPRARPKIDKWVKVKVQGNEEIHFLKLFDLSRGGIGFVSMEPQKFPKGSEIQVVGFEEFDLDDPILGLIMSHRQIDESMLEFKIGVKFNEGQD